MSKSRFLVACLLALFYIGACTSLSILMGWALGFAALWTFENQFLKLVSGIFAYYVMPVGGFALGVFYAASVLKNDRT